MAAKLLFVCMLTCATPIIISLIYEWRNITIIFWGVCAGIFAALPLILMNYAEPASELTMVLSRMQFVIVLCSIEEGLKYLSAEHMGVLRNTPGKFILVAVGFALIENYVYLMHGLSQAVSWVVLLAYGFGRTLITIPSHMSYALLFLKHNSKVLGFISAVSLHTIVNILVSQGFLIIVGVIVIGVLMANTRTIKNCI